MVKTKNNQLKERGTHNHQTKNDPNGDPWGILPVQNIWIKPGPESGSVDDESHQPVGQTHQRRVDKVKKAYRKSYDEKVKGHDDGIDHVLMDVGLHVDWSGRRQERPIHDRDDVSIDTDGGEHNPGQMMEPSQITPVKFIPHAAWHGRVLSSYQSIESHRQRYSRVESYGPLVPIGKKDPEIRVLGDLDYGIVDSPEEAVEKKKGAIGNEDSFAFEPL